MFYEKWKTLLLSGVEEFLGQYRAIWGPPQLKQARPIFLKNIFCKKKKKKTKGGIYKLIINKKKN